MFRSLRFRLPALFLAGVFLSGVVAALIALQLFVSYSHSQALRDLRREATGMSKLYNQQAKNYVAGDKVNTFAAETLADVTGDHIYYVGTELFPGEIDGLVHVHEKDIGMRGIPNHTFSFTWKPPGTHESYLAVVSPVGEHGTYFGAFILTRPASALRSGWLPLIGRLALGFLGGVLIAGGFGWYLSRRITRPVLALSDAADAIARGHYDVEIPTVPAGDEIGHLAARFREMAVRLAEAEQLERNFLMSVSHELRTPLTAIRGHVAALAEGILDDAESREQSLAVVEREAARLERLVGDVLDLAKLDAHRFTVMEEEVDMGLLCDQAFAAFQETARRRELDYVARTEERPTIVSDGDRVLQIISNLLANAIRWTPDGGRVELVLEATNGSVTVSVSDSGPGIKKEEQERIFRPFWSRDTGGTGLGLAIARELAHALGGRIELVSSPGEGSRFTLVLPARSVAHAPEPVATA
ncbi:MAG: two-component system, OmpR family, sensor kinase [Gaiellaceae bacterium]|nr:two-component system, OmpR family, sensor kinase [Gaiellaceae bacterium]